MTARKRRRVLRLIAAYARACAQQGGISPAAWYRAHYLHAYDASGRYPVRCSCGCRSCWGWGYSR